MMLITSIADRITRTRKRQTKAIDATVQAPYPTIAQGLAGPSEQIHESGNSTTQDALNQRAERNPEYVLLLSEFEALLPVSTFIYGYAEEDIAVIRSCVSEKRPGALNELRLTVQQWRIDAITNECDITDTDKGSKSLMGLGLASRARIQFRMEVMGKTHNEYGRRYTAADLDWEPEVMGWEIPISRAIGISA